MALSKAIIVGVMCEFVNLCGVIHCDIACLEGATRDGGIKDVDCGIVDGAFGSVAYPEGYG